MFKLYKALVRPKLEYCVQAWRPYLNGDILKLEKVQHRAAKMVNECRGLKYEDRLLGTGLITLEERRERGDLIQVFKMIKGIDKVDHNNFFRLAKTSRSKGHSFKLLKERARLDLRKYFFSNRVVNNWNSLPASVVEEETVNNFKNTYDKYISEKVRSGF